MRYLRHKEIDKKKWDQLVDSCPQARLYALSWYLDAACGQWDALVWGDYEAALPLPIKQWLVLKKVHVPYFVQQTGILFREGMDATLLVHQALTCKLLNRFYDFRSHFPGTFQSSLINLPAKIALQERKNFVLSLEKEYALLEKGYNDNRKRNLKKAKKASWTAFETTDIEGASATYLRYQAPKQSDFKPKVLHELARIYAIAKQIECAELWACRDEQGEILAYALFIRYRNRLYYLFGSMTERGRQSSAVSLLFDQVIRKYAGQTLILDFEGGNLEGIGQYFGSFGATPESFYSLSFHESPLRTLFTK